MIVRVWVITSALALCAGTATARVDAARDTLAWVGPRAITAEALQLRLEALPWPDAPTHGGRDSTNLRAVEALVAEQLLAQEADRRGIKLSASVGAMRAALVRALARDALYRRDVGDDSTRATAVLTRVLAGQRVAVDPPLFRLLCDSLRARMLATPSARTGRAGRIRILSEDVDDLRPAFASRLASTLVSLPGGRLTLEDVLEDLRFYEFSVHSLDPDAFARELNAHLKFVVERDLVAGEAIRQHLDRAPEVATDLATWTDAWRADALARTMGSGAALDRYVAGLAGRAGVRIDVARTMALDRPQEKMLIRRRLGFGGGMLVAPGLVPRLGWARLWRAAAPALP